MYCFAKIDTSESSQIAAIAVLLFIAILTNYFFKFFGFYQTLYPSERKEERLSGSLVVKAFVVFLISPLVLIPTIASLWFMIERGSVPRQLSSYTETWLHLISVGLSFILFTVFLFLLEPLTRHTVFGLSKKRLISFFYGCFVWLAAYPTVEFAANLLNFCAYRLLGERAIEQVAVQKLKISASFPLQYQTMIFIIIVIVPFIEELLFRGFVQTWLRQHYGRWTAILATSWIFALFHVSRSQGVSNVQVVISLFIFSCYLGFLRERQATLWAPIALHSLFNGVSLLSLTLLNP